MNSNDIEKNITDHASALGVSAAKLKAIYARGIKECVEEGYDGSPSVYGMARVQRFVVASQTGNFRLTKDDDLAPQKAMECDDVSYEFSDDTFKAWSLIYDLMSTDASGVSSMFPPESVSQINYDTDLKTVSVLGAQDGVQWSCTLNLSTGENTFITSSE